jgi:hypothetical protein
VSARARFGRALATAFALALPSILLACGGAAVGTDPPPTSTASEPPLSWSIGQFALTLPDGVRLATDAEGRVLRDDVSVWRMQPDGPLEDASGDTIAALLADGQISHRRELYPARLFEMPSVLDGARQLVLRGNEDDLIVLERSMLRIGERGSWPHGSSELDASTSPAARPLVVFVTLLELLEHPRSAAPRERPDREAAQRPDAIPPRVDVVAPPAHATRNGEQPRLGAPAGMLVFDVELLEIVDP